MPGIGPDLRLPDRVTVMTCIGCGGMGRQERCGGACSEHRLVLVRDAELDALVAAAAEARRRLSRMGEMVLSPLCADAAGTSADPSAAFALLREASRSFLANMGRSPSGAQLPPADPPTVTGWWCAECGNVDMPQPCVGVCVWRPAQWVNIDLYRRELDAAQPWLDADEARTRLVAQIAALRPRVGREQETWAALHDRALALPSPTARARSTTRGEPSASSEQKRS